MGHFTNLTCYLSDLALVTCRTVLYNVNYTETRCALYPLHLVQEDGGSPVSAVIYLLMSKLNSDVYQAALCNNLAFTLSPSLSPFQLILLMSCSLSPCPLVSFPVNLCLCQPGCFLSFGRQSFNVKNIFVSECQNKYRTVPLSSLSMFECTGQGNRGEWKHFLKRSGHENNVAC